MNLPRSVLCDYMDIFMTIIASHGIPPVIVARMLGHSISILLTTYAHFIPTMQNEAARLMDDILIPIPVDMTPATAQYKK